jgi:hypothetical protein
MNRVVLILAALVTLCTLPVCGQEEGEEMRDVSPNGRYALLKKWTFEKGTVDLIEKATGKVMVRAAESDENITGLALGALWSKDSRRLAFENVEHRHWSFLVVLEQVGDTFRHVKLPEIPDATLPEKYYHHPKLRHLTNENATGPSRWRKDGSLEIKTITAVDGELGSVVVTRTTVMAFDGKGHGRIVSSKQKVEAKINPERSTE